MGDFEAVANDVKNWKKRPSDAEFATLYGLYKQGTSGDVNIAKPSDALGAAKYDAWAAQKGKSKDEAKAEYIKLGKEWHSKFA